MTLKVATITLNPAYDLIGYLPDLNKGEVNLVNTTGLYAAGKGINVAKVLKNLGISVTVGGFLGKDNQDGFQKMFSETEITNRLTVIEGCTRINVKLTEKNSNVTDLNFSGLQITQSDWKKFTSDSLSWANKYDIICISGSIPSGVPLSEFTKWMISLRNKCLYIIFDSSDEAFNAGIKALPWLVKPNHRELEIWSGKPLLTHKDIAKVANQLCNKGIAHVVISLGSEGAMWVNESGCWFSQPPQCTVVSTVGSGDSMVAGLIYGCVMNQSTEKTLRLATAVSALSVSQPSVGMINQADLTLMMSRINLKLCNPN
ncbi:Tagatose-6-phosphate kinase [Candidatus Hartigia pinicola]|nr:Tagatose-6-phosphate kinase [Candidatus Hartigia pinicola]